MFELLEDPEYKRLQKMIATEIMRGWSMEREVAHGYVVSASGEPAILHKLSEVWRREPREESWRLIRLIIRRRTIDLLRKDAPRRAHVPLDQIDDELDERIAERDAPAFLRNPLHSLERDLIIRSVHAEIACFSTQGRNQLRQ